MTDYDHALLEEFTSSARKRCTFGKCLDAMTPEGHATVLRARELKVPVIKIHEVLAKRKTKGLPPMSSIARHFTGICRCDK